MKRKLGTVLVILGVLLVFGALAAIGLIWLHEEQSGNNAQAAMDRLWEYLPPEPQQPTEPVITATPDTPLLPNLPTEDTQTVPDEFRTMPEVMIDGVPYIGYLKIPALSLELPIIGESNEDNLEIAPCRFYGTVYKKNFVIGGHRYRRHFRKLSTLGYGETLSFTDMDGNVYTYEVAECEVIEPYEAEYLCSGDWDLSLYTCTPGGLTRVVLRCLRIPE